MDGIALMGELLKLWVMGFEEARYSDMRSETVFGVCAVDWLKWGLLNDSPCTCPWIFCADA